MLISLMKSFTKPPASPQRAGVVNNRGNDFEGFRGLPSRRT